MVIKFVIIVASKIYNIWRPNWSASSIAQRLSTWSVDLLVVLVTHKVLRKTYPPPQVLSPCGSGTVLMEAVSAPIVVKEGKTRRIKFRHLDVCIPNASFVALFDQTRRVAPPRLCPSTLRLAPCRLALLHSSPPPSLLHRHSSLCRNDNLTFRRSCVHTHFKQV